MALSPLATEFLKSIGWYPGRKLPLETVQKAYPENYEFLFDAAIEYLQEFGMLSLQSCTTPQQYPITEDGVGDEIFDFTFAYLAWGGGGKLGFLKKLTGKTWCPVGVGYNQTGFFVSKDSELSPDESDEDTNQFPMSQVPVIDRWHCIGASQCVGLVEQ